MLERSSLIPKDVWRDPSCRRTLLPIEVRRLITNAWNSNQDKAAEEASIIVSLDPDGSPKKLPSVHPMQGEQKNYIGVFDVAFISTDRVRVTLREEECALRVGLPKRRTRQIALLRPWRPVRILLNGRSSSYSGQHYLLREYHLALCSGSAPEHIQAPRLLDFQADLF